MPGRLRYVITVSGGCVMVGVWVWATEEGGQGEIMEAGIDWQVWMYSFVMLSLLFLSIFRGLLWGSFVVTPS